MLMWIDGEVFVGSKSENKRKHVLKRVNSNISYLTEDRNDKKLYCTVGIMFGTTKTNDCFRHNFSLSSENMV